MPIQMLCQRTYERREWRRVRGVLLMLAAGVVCWLAESRLAADDVPAPINRRFEVHRTEVGYELLGFRAQIGSANRFVLAAGMPAFDARQQMQSVGWGWSYGLWDPWSPELWGSRVRFQNASERVAVILDPAGQVVQTVAYEWQPALFSREGLLRYLRGAYRDGQMLVDEKEHMLIEYGALDGQVLRVEATALTAERTRWRLVFRMDAAVRVAGE